jgi:hydroxypyruvate isomerase
MPRFAANLSWLFQEHAFLDRFAAAADAGFTAVEYLFPYAVRPDQIAARLARHNLEAVLFNVAPGDFAAGERGIAVFPERRGEFRTALATALDYARATDTRRLHVMAGVASGELALASYCDCLRMACETAPDHTILIEPINAVDIPGYRMNSFDLAAQVIADLKLPNLKLQFDIYHRRMIQGGPGLEQLLPITGHVQVASAPLRQEPGPAEIQVLQLLDELAYDGWVGCEYRPANGTLAGLDWMASV